MEVRQARITDVPGIAALVDRFAGRGLILPRPTEEIYQSLREWMVAERGGQIVGCGALVILWADLAEIRSLVVAGDGPELEEITGFDEGPVHPQWQDELQKRGIEVEGDVLREEAIEVYRAFANSQGLVYNARLGED